MLVGGVGTPAVGVAVGRGLGVGSFIEISSLPSQQIMPEAIMITTRISPIVRSKLDLLKIID